MIILYITYALFNKSDHKVTQKFDPVAYELPLNLLNAILAVISAITLFYLLNISSIITKYLAGNLKVEIHTF